MDKVSVIIPVYNAGTKVLRLMQTLVQQNYRQLELLVVDDGSTDQSYDACLEFAKKDTRIRVFKKKNEGVSSARNLGILHATGKYIYFADADDWVFENAISYLVETFALYEQSDLVIGDFSTNGFALYHGTLNGYYEKADMLEDVTAHFASYYYGAVWNKLYRADIIKENHLRFCESIQWAEDILFNLDYLNCCKAVFYTQAVVYHYFFHQDTGLTRTAGGHLPHEILQIRTMRYQKLRQLIGDSNEKKSLLLQADRWFLEDINSYLTAWMDEIGTKADFIALVQDRKLGVLAARCYKKLGSKKLCILRYGLSHKSYELLYQFYYIKKRLRKNTALVKQVRIHFPTPKINY